MGSPGSPSNPSSSSQTPPSPAMPVTPPPPHPETARAAQVTPPPTVRVDEPPPQVGFQGDPSAWYALLQAQWQVCEAYKFAGQIEFEAQQREYTMKLEHQLERICSEMKSKGDTQALKTDFEQQLIDVWRRAEAAHADQESAINRQRAEADRYISEQRSACQAEQRDREED